MKQVYIVWERHPSSVDMFPGVENPRKLISIHKTMEGAIKAQCLFVSNQNIYFSIEIKDIEE